MNGHERISAVLAGKQADSPPIMLHNFLFAARQAKLSMADYRSSPPRMARALIDSARRYRLDGILTDVDTALEAFAFGAKTVFPEELPAKVVAPVSDNIEEVIDAMEPEKLIQNERITNYLEAIHLIREEVQGELFLRGNADQGPMSLAAAVYGLTNMMVDMLDPQKEPAILRLIERCYDVHLLFHRRVIDAGADMTSFGDSMGSPDLISPKLFRQFALPFHRRLVQELSADGIKTVCHVCGKTDKILDSLSLPGFAGIEIDYKTNIPQARQIMKGRSVVFGVIDPTGVFCHGNADTIENATRTVLEIFEGTDLVIGAGCALPAETPPENIERFVQTVRTFDMNKTNFQTG